MKSDNEKVYINKIVDNPNIRKDFIEEYEKKPIYNQNEIRNLSIKNLHIPKDILDDMDDNKVVHRIHSVSEIIQILRNKLKDSSSSTINSFNITTNKTGKLGEDERSSLKVTKKAFEMSLNKRETSKKSLLDKKKSYNKGSFDFKISTILPRVDNNVKQTYENEIENRRKESENEFFKEKEIVKKFLLSNQKEIHIKIPKFENKASQKKKIIHLHNLLNNPAEIKTEDKEINLDLKGGKFSNRTYKHYSKPSMNSSLKSIQFKKTDCLYSPSKSTKFIVTSPELEPLSSCNSPMKSKMKSTMELISSIRVAKSNNLKKELRLNLNNLEVLNGSIQNNFKNAMTYFYKGMFSENEEITEN